MTPLDLSSPSVLQHTLTAGTFTGVELGRASLTLGAGSSSLVLKSPELGAAGNGLAIRISQPIVAGTLGVAVQESNIVVVPAFDGSAITSTAAQIAAAINDHARLKGRLVAYTPTGSGAGLIAAGAGVLAGGSDPASGSYTRRYTSGVAAGLLYFDQKQAVEVLSIEGVFGASVAYTVKLVKFDLCWDSGAEDLQIMGATAASMFQTFTNLVIPPGRAIKIAAPSTGFVRAVVRNTPKRF